jgi:predicted permease
MLQDLKHGIRMLFKNPGFTFVAIISIAIGVGANAAMFSFADGLVFRPLPVPRSGEVVTVSGQERSVGFGNRRVSYPDYIDVRDRSRSFSGLVAYTIAITSFSDRADEPAQRKVGKAVSGNYFDAMGVRPGLGRTFRLDEDHVPGRDAVVVLDHDEWLQQFGGDPEIVDKRIHIGGVEFTVIGVTAAGFTGIDHDVRPAFYVPVAMYTTIQNGVQPDLLTRRDVRTFVVKGRLKSGVSLEQARLEVQQLATNLAQTYPDVNRNHDLLVKTEFQAYRDIPGGGDTSIVVMLMALALLVLTIACANVAGLLTSRAPVRAREVALRMAVGAGRWRLVRQLITESLLMAAGGGLIGLAFGYLVIGAFQTIEYPTDIPLKLTFELDNRALVVGIAVAAASAILSGLIPAWRATRADLVQSLKHAAATSGSSVRSRLWGRSTLVCSQVALSLLLLTVTVFIYRAFQSRLEQGPGFRTEGVLFASFEPGLARYDDARTESFYRLLKEQAGALPGVKAVALASNVPMRTDNLQFRRVAPEGFQFAQGVDSVACPTTIADEDFFDTMGIRIVQGRGFLSSDTESSAPVVIVNERFAAHYWPEQSAVGKRVQIRGDMPRVAEIVGVAADSKYFFIVEPPVEFMYVPHAQSDPGRRSLVLASNGSSAALADPLRALVRSIDPGMPVQGLRTMEDYYASRVIGISRLLVGTVGGMGTMGVILAMIGLYGLVAYSVSRRTREIGIRIAVGAAPRSVLRMVLRQGLILSAVGVAVGVVASVPTSGLLRGVFYGQAIGGTNQSLGFDALTYLLVVPALISVTLLAAYLPARRAARVDPLSALRQE